MDVTKIFPSRYLKAAELTGPVTVTVARISQEQAYKPGEGQTKIYVLYCEKASRGVVLTRPLAFSIAQALGEPDTDKWAGRRVVLFPQPMTVAGRQLVAIRARAAVNGSQPDDE